MAGSWAWKDGRGCLFLWKMGRPWYNLRSVRLCHTREFWELSLVPPKLGTQPAGGMQGEVV